MWGLLVYGEKNNTVHLYGSLKEFKAAEVNMAPDGAAGEISDAGVIKIPVDADGNFDLVLPLSKPAYFRIGRNTFLVLALIILRCYWVGRNASSPFSAYVSMGIAGMLLAQVFFNVGMCLYILPVMGLTLPFFSYGGSSIITLYTAMGIVSSIRARTLPSWLRDRNQL